MMGQHSRSEALFYNLRLEDQIPKNHLLRQIEKHISFAFVREQFFLAAAAQNIKRLVRFLIVIRLTAVGRPLA